MTIETLTEDERMHLENWIGGAEAKLLRMYDAQAAENEQLRAGSTRPLLHALRRAEAAEARVRELEAENERLRSEIDTLRKQRNQHRSEVERLQAVDYECKAWRAACRRVEKCLTSSESSLADAAALIREAGSLAPDGWEVRRETFLANQPAAPSLGHPEARVRELEVTLAAANTQAECELTARQAAEASLAAAEGLVRDGVASRDMFWQQRAHA